MSIFRRYVPKDGAEYRVHRQSTVFRWHWIGVKFPTRQMARNYLHFLRECEVESYMTKRTWEDGFLLSEEKSH